MKPPKERWNDLLHDATLEEILVRWDEGVLKLEMRTGSKRATLYAHGLTSLSCPRRQPWGASVSVNSVGFPVQNGIEIKMQTGDVLLIESEDISLEVEPRQAAIDTDELDSIASRCAAAQPAPWTSYIEGRDHTAGSNFIMVGRGDSRGADIELSGATAADQDFVAAARQDVPRLIEEIRRLLGLANAE